MSTDELREEVTQTTGFLDAKGALALVLGDRDPLVASRPIERNKHWL